MSDPKPNDPFEWTQEPWGRALRCGALSAPHLFSSRDVTLRDDDREWTMVAASMGVEKERLLLVKQVHGVSVAVARSAGVWSRPEADIILSADPDVAIGVRTADCAPILLFDRIRGVVGAAHAGWRGTASQAAAAAVRAMHDRFGSEPHDLVAAIGPCLGRCCGEVGPDVLDAFRGGGADPESMGRWFSPGTGDRSFLDLERANRDQLERAGMDGGAIHTAGLCTKSYAADLHSYRAARSEAGRMVAAIRCPS